MKTIRNLLSSLAVLALSFLAAAPAMASTDCTSTVAYVTEYGIGSSPALYVALTSGVGFYMADTDPSYKGVAGLSMAARMLGDSVTVTFAGTSVSCTTVSWRTDVTAVHY